MTEKWHEVDWYNEVVDVRRGNAPVPSNDLLFIYKTGIDAIKKSFGVVPLAAEVRPVQNCLKVPWADMIMAGWPLLPDWA